MIYLKYIFLSIFGITSGFGVASGVFTSLIAVGLVPRFAGKTHTGEKVFLYEEMVIIGTIIGCIISLFQPFLRLKELFIVDGRMIINESVFIGIANTILIIYGLFAGLFVGCLALAIAEMLNSIPIFARRIGFRHGLGIAILAMALGKAAGSLLYFIKQLFLYGGI